jgi:hypothetical protein
VLCLNVSCCLKTYFFSCCERTSLKTKDISDYQMDLNALDSIMFLKSAKLVWFLSVLKCMAMYFYCLNRRYHRQFLIALHKVITCLQGRCFMVSCTTAATLLFKIITCQNWLANCACCICSITVLLFPMCGMSRIFLNVPKFAVFRHKNLMCFILYCYQ